MILHIEKAKVLRIFANIIGNGLQAMRYKGHIRIETREASSSMIEFVLSNDGPHIPAEHLPKLFDAFFTSGKKGGTGLGLAIAHKVVVAHGGEIRCESAPDNGVSFIFTLPATHTKTPPNPISLPRQSSDFIKAASMMQPFDHDKSNEDELKFIEEFELCAKNFSRKIRILLVDDEQVYREGLREKLTRHLKLNAYIEISAVGTPEEALKFPSADLAIIDVDLDSQVMNGFDIVELLRKRGDTGIICTHSNRVLASDHKTAIDRGADAFLPKPMTTLHLLKLLCQAQKRLRLANRWCS
jgi:CheY-like chemotaxis protein